MKIYIAGKVASNSSFGKHNWRQEFIAEIKNKIDHELELIDALKGVKSLQNDYAELFDRNCQAIKNCDLFIVFLSDDISVGGSQEILIAHHYGKRVIGYAPYGGKFNNATREMFGKTITDYKDPFVFSTCDKVCGTMDELAEAINNYKNIDPRSIDDILR